MSTTARTNFGMIGHRRIMTFEVGKDMVKPAKYRHLDEDCLDEDQMITAHEAFRRWKIARKAWRTRKHGNQLSLFP